MKKEIDVKGVKIGSGRTKVCVSLVGKSIDKLIEEAKALSSIEIDLVEWRVDYFEHVSDISQVKVALKGIRKIIPEIPLIFTFRTADEGGEKQVQSIDYFQLNEEIVKTNDIDMIDIELFTDNKIRQVLIESAHENDVFVIVSNHDFEKTPSHDEIVSRLCQAEDSGGDIAKIAVMPNSSKDVLTLLEATETMYSSYAKVPIITMAMGSLGVISRVAGEVFGSAVTFAAVKQASAPGQIAVADLQPILRSLHQ